MVTSLRQWFDRQSLAVRLGALVALFALGVAWAGLPDDPVPVAGGLPRATIAAADRPVIGRVGAEAGATVPAGTGFLAPYQEPTASPSGVTWYGAARTIISVVIVLALIVFGAQGLRALGVASASSSPDSAIRVRETVRLPVAGSRSPATLHLVEVGERLLLIGASDGSVTLVTEFEQDEVEALPGAGTPRGPSAMTRTQPRRTGSDAGAATPVAGTEGPVARADDEAVLASVLRRLGESGRRLRGDG